MPLPRLAAASSAIKMQKLESICQSPKRHDSVFFFFFVQIDGEQNKALKRRQPAVWRHKGENSSGGDNKRKREKNNIFKQSVELTESFLNYSYTENIDSAFAKCALRGPAAVDPVQTDAIRGKVCSHYIPVCLCVAAAAAAAVVAREPFGSMLSVYGNDAKIVVVVN